MGITDDLIPVEASEPTRARSQRSARRTRLPVPLGLIIAILSDSDNL
jgi:hypothetical protein